MDTTSGFPSKQKKPSFITFLIKDFSSYLRIPPFFTKNFGKYVQNKALLNDSSGKTWEIEVKKDGDNFYFQKGWEIFVKDNTLEYGDFLMFKLSGNSTFKVKLYSKTCCEKEISVACENEMQEGKGHRKRRWVEVAKGIHLMEEEEVSDDERISQVDVSEQSMHKRNFERNIVQETAFISKSRKTTNLSPSKEVKFNSKYPYFAVKLRPAYVRKNFLAIPGSFFRKHMREEEQEMKLQIFVNSWTVKFTVYQYVDKFSKARMQGTGWSKFLRDNYLKVGDVCIFEMVTTDDIIFHVHIDKS